MQTINMFQYFRNIFWSSNNENNFWEALIKSMTTFQILNILYLITFVIKLSRWKWVLKTLKRLSSINISPLDPNKEKCLNKGDAGGRFLEWKNMECSEQIGKYSTNSQLWFKDVVLISKFSSLLSVFKTREHHVCVCHHFPKWKHIFFLIIVMIN